MVIILQQLQFLSNNSNVILIILIEKMVITLQKLLLESAVEIVRIIMTIMLIFLIWFTQYKRNPIYNFFKNELM